MQKKQKTINGIGFRLTRDIRRKIGDTTNNFPPENQTERSETFRNSEKRNDNDLITFENLFENIALDAAKDYRSICQKCIKNNLQ